MLWLRGDELGIERRSFLKLSRGFLSFPRLAQCDGQFEVCRRVSWNGANGGTKLGYRSVKVADTAQPTSGICGEDGGLKIGFLFG